MWLMVGNSIWIELCTSQTLVFNNPKYDCVEYFVIAVLIGDILVSISEVVFN